MRTLLTTLLAISAISIARSADLTVGTATARPGQRATGVIQVPAGIDAATNLPVIVINGARPGPTMALIAGAHGTEYASIVALQKLARTLDPAALTGALIVTPLLNLASFTQVVPHINPVDGKGMNRVYPGKPDGTQTERAAHAVYTQVLQKSDYVIDLHGGDLDENLRRYAYWADTGNQSMDATSRGMVLAFGLDHIIIQHNRTPPAPGAPVTVSRQAQNMGKPTIVAEAGRAGTVDAQDLDDLVYGCLNVMRHLKMLPGPAPAVEHPIWISAATVIPADREGVFVPLVRPEAYVQKGQIIARITDYFGDPVADVASPITGLVIYIRAIPSLKKGDTMADLGEIQP